MRPEDRGTHTRVFQRKRPGSRRSSLGAIYGGREAIGEGSVRRQLQREKACPECDFRLDFYFPDEQTAVEIALSLDKPISEYERDIFKCLLAGSAGVPIKRLLFIAKPGAHSKLRAPGPRAIANLVQEKFGLQVEVLELVPPESATKFPAPTF